jgi:dipeptidyl aminopeptidase/acylaminoacyl peptidase
MLRGYVCSASYQPEDHQAKEGKMQLALRFLPGTMISALALLLASCAVAPTSPALQSAQLPELLPVRDFVANTDYNGLYQISPDGRKLAWQAVSGLRESLFVKSLESGDVTIIPIKGEYLWAQDSRHLFFYRDRKGNEDYHVLLRDTANPDGRPVDLTPYDGTRAYVQQVIESDPRHVLIAHNRRDRHVFDLFKIDLDTGREEPVATNPGQVTRWLTDRDGVLWGRVRQEGEGYHLERYDAGAHAWNSVYQWDRFDVVAPLALSVDRKAVWMVSNRGRDLQALVKLDLATSRETVLYQPPTVDIAGLLFSHRTREPVLAYAQPDYPHIEFLDRALQSDLAPFLSSSPQGLRVTSMDDQDRLMTVEVYTALGKQFYLFDRTSKQRTLLGESASMQFAESLAPVKAIQFQSRDGLTLHGYLTLPKGAATKNLPTVLLVHGGPWFRDQWGADYYTNRLAQFLANRGYAVAQINYRGSAGYGRKFMEAAIGEFGGKMHDDLIDAVQWLVSEGITDPQRVAIAGRSFGGYAALVGLTFTPEIFACGVDIVGLSDLTTQKGPAYGELGRYWWERYFGDPDIPADLEKMKQRSPYYHADAIRRPVLIAYGANDARVQREQSEKMIAALEAAHKEVQSLVLRNEGHLITRWPSNLTMYRRIEDFLAGCLGGRSSGFDYYQLGAWAF